MKNAVYFLIVIFGLNIYSHQTSAQSNAAVFKLNLLSPVVSTASGAFEIVLAENFSLQIGGFYSGASVLDYRLRGFGFTPEFRIYLSEIEDAPRGFFVAPYLRYRNFDVERTDLQNDFNADFRSYGAGLVVGRQWIFQDRVSIEGFFGPDFNIIDLQGNANDPDFNLDDYRAPFLSGFGIRAGVTLGIAF
jgi:hypothetical protein